jgi:hypothetical protein
VGEEAYEFIPSLFFADYQFAKEIRVVCEKLSLSFSFEKVFFILNFV